MRVKHKHELFLLMMKS